MNIESLNEKYKLINMYKELTKTDIHPLFIFLVEYESYEKWKDKMYQLNFFMETLKNLTDHNESVNKVNRVQKGKLPYIFKDNKQHNVHIENNFCYICEKYGPNTKNCLKLPKNQNKTKTSKFNNEKKRKINFKFKRQIKNISLITSIVLKPLEIWMMIQI